MLLSRNSATNSEINTVEVFHDEATHQKIRRHLSDKTDIISEEDIENVKTNFAHINPPVPDTDEDVG